MIISQGLGRQPPVAPPHPHHRVPPKAPSLAPVYEEPERPIRPAKQYQQQQQAQEDDGDAAYQYQDEPPENDVQARAAGMLCYFVIFFIFHFFFSHYFSFTFNRSR